MNQFWSERAHTLRTTTTGSKNSQKGVNSQVDYHNNNALGPKGLSFTGLRTQLKSSARHTLSNQQSQLKEAETVNLIENAQRDTFKAPCCCFENAPNTALPIVCTINVSIDCKKNKVSNPFSRKNILDCKSRHNELLGLCFVLK